MSAGHGLFRSRDTLLAYRRTVFRIAFPVVHGCPGLVSMYSLTLWSAAEISQVGFLKGNGHLSIKAGRRNEGKSVDCDGGESQCSLINPNTISACEFSAFIVGIQHIPAACR
jgi:hypothetical protein